MKCTATTTWGLMGPIAPRPCRNDALVGRDLCATHARMRPKKAAQSADGAWCVWCGATAKRYTPSAGSTTPIALCLAHGEELRIALEGTRLERAG